ncbi:M23 family metallopeptidase [Candidatus Peribacteria bacterium]|nr:M23 family metallopeptidase [Candidatus Peribacteria bacterium]
MRTRSFIGFLLLLAGCALVDHPTVLPNGEMPSSASTRADVVSPISNAETRVTKKPFRISISPTTSPVQPERFSGYHTGTDFETFLNEQDTDVEIFSICSGKVRFTGWVKGYGGVLIQDCTYENEPVTVLYGHLSIDSVSLRSGVDLSTGGRIGNLGKGFSTETDGERKHLHLSIHRGMTIEYRGYVQTEEELSDWTNPFPQIP